MSLVWQPRRLSAPRQQPLAQPVEWSVPLVWQPRWLSAPQEQPLVPPVEWSVPLPELRSGRPLAMMLLHRGP